MAGADWPPNQQKQKIQPYENAAQSIGWPLGLRLRHAGPSRNAAPGRFACDRPNQHSLRGHRLGHRGARAACGVHQRCWPSPHPGLRVRNLRTFLEVARLQVIIGRVGSSNLQTSWSRALHAQRRTRLSAIWITPLHHYASPGRLSHLAKSGWRITGATRLRALGRGGNSSVSPEAMPSGGGSTPQARARSLSAALAAQSHACGGVLLFSRRVFSRTSRTARSRERAAARLLAITSWRLATQNSNSPNRIFPAWARKLSNDLTPWITGMKSTCNPHSSFMTRKSADTG